ncbi:MAG TPA: DUF2269 family protein [Longimicrobiales bacterium]|nr:DUF2269 family protein [Longimicrobiales bacterium]
MSDEGRDPMFTWYRLFTFVHIMAAILWIGGATIMAALSARLARVGEHSALQVVARQNEFVGRALLGPAALITLLAGLALMGLSRLGLPLWMAWGLAGALGSMALGGGYLAVTGRKLAEEARSEQPDRGRMAALQRRLSIGTVLNIALLVSVVWAMVFKPEL